MNKYVIELRPDCKVVQEICESDGKVSIGAKSINYLEELNSDYINEHFGDLQDDAYKRGLEEGKKATWGLVADASDAEYQRGLNDAWECGKKLAWTAKYGGYSERLNDVFGRDDMFDFYDYTPNEAIAKLKAYEEKQKAEDEIKRGDIVERYLNGKLDSTGIYLGEDDGYWNCLFWTGTVFGTFTYPKNQFKKTGRHVDIEKILEEMKA